MGIVERKAELEREIKRRERELEKLEALPEFGEVANATVLSDVADGHTIQVLKGRRDACAGRHGCPRPIGLSPTIPRNSLHVTEPGFCRASLFPYRLITVIWKKP